MGFAICVMPLYNMSLKMIRTTYSDMLPYKVKLGRPFSKSITLIPTKLTPFYFIHLEMAYAISQLPLWKSRPNWDFRGISWACSWLSLRLSEMGSMIISPKIDINGMEERRNAWFRRRNWNQSFYKQKSPQLRTFSINNYLKTNLIWNIIEEIISRLIAHYFDSINLLNWPVIK